MFSAIAVNQDGDAYNTSRNAGAAASGDFTGCGANDTPQSVVPGHCRSDDVIHIHSGNKYENVTVAAVVGIEKDEYALLLSSELAHFEAAREMQIGP